MNNLINKRIREARIKKNLTLLEVANKLGVSEATVQRYESGEIKNIKHKTIQDLSNIFDVSPSFLMGWDEDQNSVESELNINTLAAHKEGEDWTEEELETIEMVKEMLRQKRKKKLGE